MEAAQENTMINDDVNLKRILQETRCIAMVGLSANPMRPSHEVAEYLMARGYTVIPVNPGCTEVLGQRCYPALRDIPVAVDMVDVFRNPDDVLPIAKDAIAIGARTLWLQLGVINLEAARLAENAGLQVVMDHCPKIEYGRLCADRVAGRAEHLRG
jgi:predicted CoA-binding protein